MKTLEFKLYLNTRQVERIEQWLDVQRWVWNQGLAILKEFEQFAHYNKHDKAYAPCCPVPWEYRWQRGDDGEWVAIPYSRVAVGRNGWQCCPIPQVYREPQIDRDSEYSLMPWFAHKLHPDKPWYRDCPYKVSQSTIKALATAWQEYRKGKRKSPRFKRRGDNRSFSNTQPGNLKIDGDRIKLPKLGFVRVKTLAKRWPKGLDILSFRVIKEPSGYYLMLVGEIESPQPKPTGIVAGLDAGIRKVGSNIAILHDDAGKHIEMPAALRRRLKKIQRLSRKAARQKDGSANKRKTYQALARTHEKVRRERKSWHHKLSTFAVRKYDAIAVENLNLQGLGRKAKAKPKAGGSGYEHNHQAQKRGQNRALRDAGIGGLYTMMEAKAKTAGRQFERVNPAYTSQTCNACGAVAKASRDNEKFKCVHCGHEAHADTNAATNIRDAAFPESRKSYPAWTGNVKPASASYGSTDSEGQQEPEQSGSRGAASPISISSVSDSDQSRELGGVCNSNGQNPHSVVPKTRRQRRSAQSPAESGTQLSIWDIAPETG